MREAHGLVSLVENGIARVWPTLAIECYERRDQASL